jgi:RND family efflux transporter MFP subunit
MYQEKLQLSIKMRPSLKYYVLGISLFLYLSSCNQAEKDPKVRLEALKATQKALNDSIAHLEMITGGKSKTDSAQIRFSQVALLPVESVDFVHTIDVQGKVESDQNIEVNPKTMGIITKVNVTEGQKVHQGQVLATIDNELLKGNLEQLKSQYSLATILYQKQKNLWDQQIGTEVQYLQAKNNKENLEKNMEIIKEQLSQTNIVSPINGMVDQVIARVGQMAAAGAPQFRIVNSNKIKVTAGLGENYISQVGVGSSVVIDFPDAGKTVHTKLGFVSSVIDPVTRTFTVQTKLEGETGIRPNMIAVFKIQDYHNPKALVVPINLVQNSEEGSYVFIAEKGPNPHFGVARKKPVQLGLIQGDKVEIKKGLNPNDLLITVGYQGLTDGASLSF